MGAHRRSEKKKEVKTRRTEYKRDWKLFLKAVVWNISGLLVKDEVREESKFQSMKWPSVSEEEFVLHTFRKVGSHWRTLIRARAWPFRFRFLRLQKDPSGYSIENIIRRKNRLHSSCLIRLLNIPWQLHSFI